MASSSARATAVPRQRNRSRRYDVVLFGATGFTGKLVAEYLLSNYTKSDLRWALAGRSPAKLEAVRDALCTVDPSAAKLPLLVADSHDRASLDAVAAEAEVVCTTVGPYAHHGSDLVASAVAHGTDYCDLTGEVQWIRRMIDAHHEEAVRTGARIVHCCGFDSIPSDIGTLMLAEHMREKHGQTCREVKHFMVDVRGGFSGGSFASLLNVLTEAGRDASVRGVLRDPYALNPEGERQGPDRRDAGGIGRDADLPGWTAPAVMASINARIVRRSNALLRYRYGKDLRYVEVMGFPLNVRGLFTATGYTAVLGAALVALVLPPTRALLEHTLLPAPGEGPSEEARRRGRFRIVLVGKSDGGNGASVVLRGRIEGNSDPGYSETAKMLAESALCLALQGNDLPSGGGVLTPASCMGVRLLDRLRRAGMTFAMDGA